MHRAVGLVSRVGGAGAPGVASRGQGAGRRGRRRPARRRTSGALDARRAVPDAAAGSPVPFARGPQGYAGSPGEPYIALGSGHRVPGAGCAFRRDVIFALDPDATPGIVRVDRSGRSSRFADLPAGAFPAGIAIDTVGLFGYRILVTSFASGTTTLYAFDCRGRARVVATGAPHVEGGIAVAPRTFGRFGGKLIAVDEVTGGSTPLAPAVGFASWPSRDFLPAGTSESSRSASYRQGSVAAVPHTSRIWEPRARRRAARTAC